MAILKRLFLVVGVCSVWIGAVDAARRRKPVEVAKPVEVIRAEPEIDLGVVPVVAAGDDESVKEVVKPIVPERRRSGVRKRPVAIEKKVSEKKSVARKSRAQRPVSSFLQRRVARRMHRTGLMTGPYGELQQSIIGKTPKISAGKRFLSAASGVIPIGIAAAGTQQLVQGNKKIGAGLLMGATVAAVARAVMIQKQLKKAAETFDAQMKEFLVEWPTKKETVPLMAQPPLEAMYKQYTATKGKCSGEELVSFAYSLDAWKSLEQARVPVVMNDMQKCIFVRKELGDIQRFKLGPKFFMARMVADAFQITYFGLPFTQIIGFAAYFFPLFFYGPLRRYVFRFQKTLESRDDAGQSLVDSGVVQKELPFKLIEPIINKLTPDFIEYDDPYKVLARAGFGALASIIVMLGIKAVAGICNSVFMRKYLYKTHLLNLDAFMTTWPGLKHQVPSFLHERFDDLYGNRFDTKTGTLRLTDRERVDVLRQVSIDIDIFLKNYNKKPQPAANAAVVAAAGVAV